MLGNGVKLASLSVTPTINLCVGIFGDVTAARQSTTEHAIVAHYVVTTHRGVNCVLTNGLPSYRSAVSGLACRSVAGLLGNCLTSGPACSPHGSVVFVLTSATRGGTEQ